jgi:hypothetical protein
MSGTRRHILAGLIIGTALLTAGQERLGACSCIGPIVACESAWTSDSIFVGKVLSVGPVTETAGPFVRRQRVIRFDVQEAFKSAELGTLEVTTGAGGGDCGYSFTAGRTYVVFAHRNTATGQLGAGICSRTAPVEDAAEDLAYLRGPFATPSDLGVVQGTVTRQDPPAGPNQPSQRSPFPGAEIRLEGYTRAYNATSGDDGSYSFRVPAGEYRVLVNVRDGVYAWPGPQGRTVTLQDNRGCAVMDVLVRPDSRIAGRLLAADGRPVPFMSVELATQRQVQSPSLYVSTRVLTDAEGRFEFTQLDPGPYVPGLTLHRNAREKVDLAVWISPDGSGTPAVATVESEGRVDLGDVRLPSGLSTLTLRGVVVWPDGTPVHGADVRFTDPGPNMRTLGAPVPTDEQGRFALSVIGGRSYRISAESRSTIPGVARYLSARSDPFEAAGDIPPFRLVVTPPR